MKEGYKSLKDLSDKVKELLFEVSEKAYNEGRTHERDSNAPHIRRAYSLHDRKCPNTFKETKIYKEIKDNWNETKDP